MSATILVIEDNEQNLYLMRFLLETRGFRVLSATDGKGGIDVAARLRPDCILLDIQLPELNGYQVAEALRRQPYLKNTPIIVVTSYAMPGDREKALESGATDYIEKPINPDTFLDQIETYLPKNS